MRIAATTLIVLALAVGRLYGGDTNQAPPIPEQEQPEVLTSGPVHEAFAEPVNVQVQAGLVVPDEPPAKIQELPPAEKPPSLDLHSRPTAPRNRTALRSRHSVPERRAESPVALIASSHGLRVAPASFAEVRLPPGSQELAMRRCQVAAVWKAVRPRNFLSRVRLTGQPRWQV